MWESVRFAPAFASVYVAAPLALPTSIVVTLTVAPFAAAVTVSVVEAAASSVTASDPLSSCCPLNRVRVPMFWISAVSASISSPIA